jgi:hypothetical protein
MSRLIGKVWNIQWADFISPTVSIYKSVDGGDYSLITDSAPNPSVELGSYNWTIDTAAGIVQLKIVDNIDTDVFLELDAEEVSAQVLTAVVVSPSSARVAPGKIKSFTALGYNQESTLMTVQPTFSWSVSEGGSIDSDGVFTAGNVKGGPFTITATSGGKSDTAAVIIDSDSMQRYRYGNGFGF